MSKPAAIGHNRPPDPLDEVTAPYADAIAESENWLDGTAVETEDQMRAVDVLAKEIRAARSALKKAKESATAPLHDAWKREIARWKPTEDDLDRIQKGLATAVEGFKKRKAAEQAEAERKARAEAEAKRRAAELAAMAANVADIEAQRAAAQAQAEAQAAEKTLAATRRDKVTGLRETDMYAIDDHKKALHWIAANDREAVTAFIEEYVRRNFRARAIDGVRTWREKVAI